MVTLFRRPRSGAADDPGERADPAPVLAGTAGELARAGRLVVQAAGSGVPVVIIKTERGLFAFEDECPHAGSSLRDGEIAGTTVTCPWHGRRFSLKSGRCVSAPGTAGRLRRWRAWLADDQVWIGQEIR
jgi:nitrite reductase/ring-hydroxylating ferredoxin subunit